MMPEDILLNGNYNVGNLISLNHRELIFTFLQKGYVDAIAGHESALRTFVETDPDAYRILDESLYNSELGIAFIKGSDNEVIGKLAQALNEMQEDGTTRKIIEKYGLNPETAFSDMKGVQEWK